MKDKYYTPTLEELISHVIKGEIVYAEVYGNSRLLELPTENSILYLMAFLKCHANIVGRSIVDLDIKQFRIKYLDGEDIISIGFVEESKDFYEGKKEDYISLDYFVENKGWYLAYGENESQFGFSGFIKNISELKVLLKQLNVLPSSI